MNNHKDNRPFYFTLFDYLYDSKRISSKVIDELKPHFYIERVDFSNVSTLFVYYLDETKWEEYQDVLELITLLLGCENLITIDMNNKNNLETIQTMNYKVFLEIMYLRSPAR